MAFETNSIVTFVTYEIFFIRWLGSKSIRWKILLTRLTESVRRETGSELAAFAFARLAQPTDERFHRGENVFLLAFRTPTQQRTDFFIGGEGWF